MWIKTEELHGIAICNFQKTDIPHALSLLACDKVVILEKCEGWYRGYKLGNIHIKGIFPSSYVHITTSFRNKFDGADIHAHESEDEVGAVVADLAEILKEWCRAIHKLYIGRPGSSVDQKLKLTFHTMIDQEIPNLLRLRLKIMNPLLPKRSRHIVRAEIANKIDWGNKMLGLDVIPRRNGVPVDPRDVCTVEFYRLHQSTGQTGSAGRHNQRQLIGVSHHMYLKLHCLTVSEQSAVMIYFFLYNSSKSEFLTERVLCEIICDSTRLSAGNQSLSEFEKAFSAIFVDLAPSDLSENTYLVAQIYKRSGLSRRNSSSTTTVKYKRPFGCAALLLKDVLKQSSDDRGLSDSVTSDTSYNMAIELASEAEDFDRLLARVIDKVSREGNTLGNSYICVGINNLHGEISVVKKKWPTYFAKEVNIVERIGFAEILAPEHTAQYLLLNKSTRNDLFVIINKASFEGGRLTTRMKIEAKLMVVNRSGAIVEYCIHSASGETAARAAYETAVFYHNNKPAWNEVIKLQIPIDIFAGCHVRIEFRHCSTGSAEKIFYGYSFLPLENTDGTTIQDGCHNLTVHRPVDNQKKPQEVHKYLSLPFKDQNNGNSSETCTVTTRLCSTALTQDVNLVKVYRWDKCLSPPELIDVLMNTAHIKNEELVRHHKDYFNTLFSIMNNCSSHMTVVTQVLRALIRILKLSTSKTYQQFQTVINAYIEKDFCNAQAYVDLVNQISTAMSRSDETSRILFDDMLSVFDLLFKFIIKSAQLAEKLHPQNPPHEKLAVVMSTFWSSVKTLLASSSEVNCEAFSCKLIIRLVDIFPQLMAVFTADEIASSYVSVLSKLPKRNSELGTQKLNCLAKAVKSKLFEYEEARDLLLKMGTQQIKVSLASDGCEMKTVSSVLSDLLIAMRHHKVSSAHVELVTIDLLPQVFHRICSDHSDGPLIYSPGQLISAMATMLSMIDDTLFSQMLSLCITDGEAVDMYVIVMRAFRLSQQLIPRDWSAVHLEIAKALLDKTACMCNAMFGVEINYEEDDNLWVLCFQYITEFITQPALQLELFGERKRMVITERYGDMRLKMADLLVGILTILGENHRKVNYDLLEPILTISLIPQPALRYKVIPLLLDMFICDESLESMQFEEQVVDLLDDLILKKNYGDDGFIPIYRETMLNQTKVAPNVKERVAMFVNSTVKLINLLLDYRSIKQSRSSNVMMRILSIVSLLEFYETEVRCPALFARYVGELAELYLDIRQYTEAGLTLLLDAQRYDWSEQPVVMSHSSMKSWEKKEDMYLKAITLLDKGQSWEEAIPYCKELISFYETKLYDYKKLVEAMALQSSLFTKIKDEIRPERSYFRVAFYGRLLPRCIRNKSFIYRGGACEQVAGVLEMFKTDFPGVLLYSSPIDEADEVTKLHSQSYYQVVPAKPVVDRVHLCRSAIAEVPLKYIQYYCNNQVSLFVYDKSYHEGERDKENEHKTLHYTRTLFRTARPLPGISNWMEIISTERTTLKPIECAIDTVTKKVQDLRDICQKYRENPRYNINELSQAMSGTINAAVNGGISKYEEAFLTSDYIETHEDDQHLISQLKSLITDLLIVLKDGMHIFGQRVKEEQNVVDLYSNLVESFDKLCRRICQTLELNTTDLFILAPAHGLLNHDSPRASSGYLSSDQERISAYSDSHPPDAAPRKFSSQSAASSVSLNQEDQKGLKNASRLKLSLKSFTLTKLYSSESQLDQQLKQSKKNPTPQRNSTFYSHISEPTTSDNRLSNTSTLSSEHNYSDIEETTPSNKDKSPLSIQDQDKRPPPPVKTRSMSVSSPKPAPPSPMSSRPLPALPRPQPLPPTPDNQELRLQRLPEEDHTPPPLPTRRRGTSLSSEQQNSRM